MDVSTKEPCAFYQWLLVCMTASKILQRERQGEGKNLFTTWFINFHTTTFFYKADKVVNQTYNSNNGVSEKIQTFHQVDPLSRVLYQWQLYHPLMSTNKLRYQQL